MKDAHINNMRFYRGKKVFVTGNTGFKGAWLCVVLNYLGADVTGYALGPEEGCLFEKINGADLVHYIEGDVRDYNKLKDAIKKSRPEIVFHLAALAQVKDCYENPIDAYSTNVMGTVNLLEALRDSSDVKSIVIVTTDKVYENKGDGAIYNEDDLLGGSDPYATSKTSMEYVSKAYRESFFLNGERMVGVATVRASNVLAGGDHVQSRLIPSILNAVANGKTVELRNPNQTRPWQSVLDALNGYLTVGRLLYDKPSDYSEGWNIGPTIDGIRKVSWVLGKISEYYNNIQTTHGKRLDVKESETLGLDISKSLIRLDWEPRLSCEEMIKKVVEFYRAQQEGENEYNICLKQVKDYYTEQENDR